MRTESDDAMAYERDEERQRLLVSVQERAAAGQIDRREFLQLAAATDIESACAVGLADQVRAAPVVHDPGGRRIAAAYDSLSSARVRRAAPWRRACLKMPPVASC